MRLINNINKHHILTVFAGSLLMIFALSCERVEEGLRPATFPKTPEIFINGFSAGLEYAAFGDSKVTAFTVDEKVSYEGLVGTSSMRFDVPNEGDPEGPYAGGVFRDLGGRDLTDYDALTFYARGSKPGTVDLIGFGNDFEGDKYSATTSIKLNTSWTKYIIPIPDPAKLSREKGLLVIAEGPEDGDGYSIWLDVVQFEKLGTLAHPRPAILNGEDITTTTFIGVSSRITGLTQTMNLPNGADQVVNSSPSYFNFNSSDTTVARVNALGVVTVVGEGTAKITATLGGVGASGSLSVVSRGQFTPAPTPDKDPVDVISVFSNAYTNVPVDFYNGFFAPFQTTQGGADLVINNDNIIRYTDLNFVAIQFTQPTINATAMTHLHVDIQVEDPIQQGDFIRIQLVDFGADAAFGGDNDTNGSVTFNSPPLETGSWVGLDIPLADLSGLSSTANLAQLFFISDATISTILVDNVYFYNDAGSGGTSIPPTAAAPNPSEAPENVISIYSDAYTNVAVQGFNLYGAATFEEVQFSGNSALRYTSVVGDGGNFQVIELGGQNQIDAAAAGMTNFRFDLWFPNAVGTSSAFLMKVVDIPSGGLTEGQINISPNSTPEMAQGSWLSYDIPFTQLENNGLGGKSNIQQIVIDLLSSGEVYIDNIYFYKSDGTPVDAPTTAAPAPPARDAADVISLFSNAYTNEPVGTWSAEWDDSAVEDVQIVGDDVKKYTFNNFAGIDFSGNKLNASEMTNFHMDIWTPDEVLDKSLSIKIVDFGGGNAEASNFILTVVHTTAGNIPALAKGSWVSIDVPISAFSGDITRSDLAQIVLSSNLTTVYIDNLYFYKSGGGTGSEPTVAAPTPPARDAANVVSIFSDAYTNISGINLNPDWGQSTVVSEISVAGNNTLKYANFNYQGTDFSGNAQDVSGMQFLHVDMWTADATDVKVTPVNGSGSPAESLVGLTPITAGQWKSYDIPLSSFTASGMSLNQVIQMKFDGQGGTTPSNIYLDNIYFYKETVATEPTTAAPAPPARDAADVVSIFSDAYTNISGINLNPDWGQSTVVSEVSVAGNNTLKYANFNYQGTDFSGNAQDVSGMQFLHVDMWTADATDVKVTPINGSGSPAEFLVGLTPISAGQWKSYDIPLSSFTASGMSLNQVIQMKFDGQGGTTPSNIYLDNIYFYKETVATEPTTAAPAPPARDAADVVSIFSDAYTNISGINLNPDWGQSTVVSEVSVAGNNTLKYANFNYQGTDFSGNAQDVSGMQFLHVDMWTADATDVKVTPINGSGSPAEFLVGLTPITAGQWRSYDIPLSSFTASGMTLNQVIQMKFDGQGGTTPSNIYLDNIYFYKTGSGGGGGELTINGDFETGDITGWTSFASDNNGTFEVTDSQANGGTYSGLLVADVDGIGAPSFPLVKQANIGIGSITPNTEVTISFDLYGSVAGAGGVVFAEFFSELSEGGVSKAEILGSGPVFPNATWTNYTFTTTTGNDVSGGVTLQLKADCGGNAGCKIDAYFDNVSVKISE